MDLSVGDRKQEYKVYLMWMESPNSLDLVFDVHMIRFILLQSICRVKSQKTYSTEGMLWKAREVLKRILEKTI